MPLKTNDAERCKDSIRDKCDHIPLGAIGVLKWEEFIRLEPKGLSDGPVNGG